MGSVAAYSYQLPQHLGSNLDSCSVGHGLPYLVHFLVRDGDATVGPIPEAMSRSEGSIAIRQAMDINLTAGRHPAPPRRSEISHAGIGNMDRFVKLAVRIARVQNVGTFWCLVISLVWS